MTSSCQDLQGAGTVGSGGQMTPQKFTWGQTWYFDLHPRFVRKKYFLVHRSVDSQQNHSNRCHQLSAAKMHQIWLWLGLCPRPRWGSLQRSPRLP